MNRLGRGLRKLFRNEHPEMGAGKISSSFETNGVLNAAQTPLTKQIIIISFVANLMGLAMPLAIFQIYDRILPNQSSATLFWLTFGLLVAVIIDTLLRTLRSYILGWAALKNGHQAQQMAMKRMLTKSQFTNGSASVSKWLDGFDAISEYSSFQGSQNRIILIDMPMAFIFLGVVAMVGGILVLVPIILVVAFGIFSYLQGNEVQKFLSNRSQQDNRQNEFLLESFTNIQTVKSLAVESQLLRRFEMLQKTSTFSSYNAIISTNKLQTQGTLFSNMMMVCVVSFGAIRVINGDMSMAALACCSLLTGRMVQPFAKALTLFHELQNINLAKSRCEVFKGGLQAETSTDVSDSKPILGSLNIRDIKLTKGDSSTVRQAFSFNAKAGEFIGIHCQENAERTELVNILRGHDQPEKGNVFLDGYSSKQWNEFNIGQEIGFVSAKSEIFEGSIIDNITMFGSGNLVENAREASRIIGLERDIFKLPDGYDTLLSAGSTSVLSPGFLQRIKIARTLMRKPTLLIFDGANSSMDMRSDKFLTEGLEKLKGSMTAVYFSSRPSFLKISDQRLKLENGNLVPDEWAQQQAAKATQAKSA